LQLDNSTNEQNAEEVKVIPVIEQKGSFNKILKRQDITIEKRWVTENKTITIPIKYEQLFINGRPAKPTDGIMDSLRDGVGGNTIRKVKVNDKNRVADETVPLMEGRSDTETIPLYGEEIIITKRLVKLEDAIIRKRQVTENKKIVIPTTKDRVEVKYPSGRKERIVEAG